MVRHEGFSVFVHPWHTEQNDYEDKWIYKSILLRICGEVIIGNSSPIVFMKVEKTNRSIAALTDKGLHDGRNRGQCGGGREKGQEEVEPKSSLFAIMNGRKMTRGSSEGEAVGLRPRGISRIRYCDGIPWRSADELGLHFHDIL